MEKQAEAQAIIDFAKTQLTPVDVGLGGEGDKVVAVSTGQKLESLKKFHDEWLEAPRRRQGTAVHKTLKSLIEHANRFKSGDSVLYADPGDGERVNPTLQSVLNYVPAGPAQNETAWSDHRGFYAFPLSDQWKLWKSLDGVKQNVRQFSTFIERQIEDIADPAEAGAIAKQIPDRLKFRLATPAEVLSLSKGLSVVVDSTVTNIYDPSTSEMKLQFETTHKDRNGKPLEVIKAFLLLIPVFQSGTVYPVGVRLTYEVNDNAAFFTTHLYREDLFFKDAFEISCEEARRGTELPLFFGSPEK